MPLPVCHPWHCWILYSDLIHTRISPVQSPVRACMQWDTIWAASTLSTMKKSTRRARQEESWTTVRALTRGPSLSLAHAFCTSPLPKSDPEPHTNRCKLLGRRGAIRHFQSSSHVPCAGGAVHTHVYWVRIGVVLSVTHLKNRWFELR